MPYPLNPFEIITNSKGSQACNEVKEAFTPELGSSYDFTKSKFEILHDVVAGRVKAADSTLHNFGVQSLKTYHAGKDQVLMEVLQKSYFSMTSTGTVIFTLRAQIEVFGAVKEKKRDSKCKG